MVSERKVVTYNYSNILDLRVLKELVISNYFG